MKKFSICIISDTHGKHKYLKLPEANIIIHCGDMTTRGQEHEIINFFKWYGSLDQYKYKFLIAGNHDWLFERNKLLALSLVPKNIIYLEDNEITIEGIKFYATPVQKIFNNWAFNRPDYTLLKHWQNIPDDTDVLITHSPPYMIGDYVPRNKTHEGSPTLYEEITKRIKSKIHCFGHIHMGHGVYVIGETTFINASNLNDNYECVFDPIVIEIDENKKATVINQ